MKTISIIGGGFCGTMILYHLTQQEFSDPVTINFYDDQGLHGRGVAYSTPFSEHLLNVPASGMSALPDDPENFMAYLGANANPAGFYPRKTYGDYIYTFLEKSIQSVRDHGHSLNIITGPAPGNDNSDILIHAGGTSKPLWPGGRENPAAGKSLIDHPYGPEFQSFLTDCNRCRTILIFGTGLSAVDAILSLNHAGYTGQIVCISRHGLWPVCHGPKQKIWHWRKYIDGLRPHSNDIWLSLPGFLKKLFLRNITFWNVIRHRMPPECYRVIKKLKDQRRLRTVCGYIEHIKVSPDDVYETCLKGGGGISGDAIINCLGFINLKGAKRCPVSKGSYRISLERNEYMIGPPLFGYLIETSAVPELRVQARDVVSEVMETLKKQGGG